MDIDDIYLFSDNGNYNARSGFQVNEIKLTDGMSLFYTTKIEDHSFSHEFGVKKQERIVLDSYDLTVKTSDGRWHSITAQIPESFALLCEDIINEKLNE